MRASIFWFRNDLRLTDNAALAAACAVSTSLVLVYVRSPDETVPTPWAFPRWGAHRQCFRDQALAGLALAVSGLGNRLLVLEGRPDVILPALAQTVGAQQIYCETIAAPEERAEVANLRATGLEVHEVWHSSLLDLQDLPFPIVDLPEVFTAFRQAIERSGVTPRPALAAPIRLPPASLAIAPQIDLDRVAEQFSGAAGGETCAIARDGSEAAALVHVKRYFGSPAPQTYKQTRNQLTGTDFSTGLSPWLAVGAVSPRTAFEHLKQHEVQYGANDSTYWIYFELLWRDFFRFWSLKHGPRLFRSAGLSGLPPPTHDLDAFNRWRNGTTGHAFIDAGMRELAATGHLSNRMRQVVASYLIHELACDWRAGAAWFEACLIDYDVCSNQGNWLYIAGRGADPRQGRWFDPDKQAQAHDPDPAYRAQWRAPSVEPTS